MNSAEVLPLHHVGEAEEEFEISITVWSKQSDRHMSYLISQREIDHGHVPRIVAWMKDRLKEVHDATSQGKESQDA